MSTNKNQIIPFANNSCIPQQRNGALSVIHNCLSKYHFSATIPALNVLFAFAMQAGIVPGVNQKGGVL